MLSVPTEFSTPGIREMKEADAPVVQQMLTEYQKRFKVHFNYSVEEVKHLLVPRKNVVQSFVVEKDGKITDFISYYIVPSSCLKHETIKQFTSGYVYYYFNTVTPLQSMIGDILVDAKRKEIDVMNALNIMESKTFFEDLKFGIGDGCLFYYLFNWKIPTLKPEDIGIVLV